MNERMLSYGDIVPPGCLVFAHRRKFWDAGDDNAILFFFPNDRIEFLDVLRHTWRIRGQLHILQAVTLEGIPLQALQKIMALDLEEQREILKQLFLTIFNEGREYGLRREAAQFYLAHLFAIFSLAPYMSFPEDKYEPGNVVEKGDIVFTERKEDEAQSKIPTYSYWVFMPGDPITNGEIVGVIILKEEKQMPELLANLPREEIASLVLIIFKAGIKTGIPEYYARKVMADALSGPKQSITFP